jgi:tetratricopeptide (TPR) repeat protein
MSESAMGTAKASIPSSVTKDVMKGDAAYVIEAYETALLCYASALRATEQWRTSLAEEAVSDTSIIPELIFHILLHRLACYIQLQQYENALSSVREALSSSKYVISNELKENVLMQKQLEFAHRQCAIAAYELQDYALSHESFQTALEYSSSCATQYNSHYYEEWMQKCQAQLPHNNNATVTAPAAVSQSTSVVESVSPPSFSKLDITNMTPKYQYYQNDSTMTVVLLEPNVQASDLKVDYSEQQIHVQLRKLGCDLHIIHGELFDAIVPDKCKVSFRADKVLIKLHKKNVNYEWQTLLSGIKTKNSKGNATEGKSASNTATSTDAIMTDAPIVSSGKPSSTSSAIPKPYASQKNWDQIEKELDAEQEPPVGDEAMNRLFQQIYANANEDTRRAMIKSYQTSGGTVLSTNWEEVAGKDYEKERIAPEGQEWKTWEGRKL